MSSTVVLLLFFIYTILHQMVKWFFLIAFLFFFNYQPYPYPNIYANKCYRHFNILYKAKKKKVINKTKSVFGLATLLGCLRLEYILFSYMRRLADKFNEHPQFLWGFCLLHLLLFCLQNPAAFFIKFLFLSKKWLLIQYNVLFSFLAYTYFSVTFNCVLEYRLHIDVSKVYPFLQYCNKAVAEIWGGTHFCEIPRKEKGKETVYARFRKWKIVWCELYSYNNNIIIVSCV